MTAPLAALISLAAGALIAIQAPIYARMTALLGSPFATVLVAFSSAAFIMAAGFLLTGQSWPGRETLRALPLGLWIGGVLGILVVIASVLAVPRLGSAGYIAAVIAGQLAMALLLDRFGFLDLSPRPVGWQGVAGVGLVGLGAALLIWR